MALLVVLTHGALLRPHHHRQPFTSRTFSAAPVLTAAVDDNGETALILAAEAGGAARCKWPLGAPQLGHSGVCSPSLSPSLALRAQGKAEARPALRSLAFSTPGAEEQVQSLLASGADATIASFSGWTALHGAAGALVAMLPLTRTNPNPNSNL
jgi:ankyrin repeat protein